MVRDEKDLVEANLLHAVQLLTHLVRCADQCRLGDLCERAGTGPRTLQRKFLQYAGVSPTWVIRRYRLLEAAESVREGRPVSWAEIAAGLGYADQAHLIRDFRAAMGQTPAAYAGSQSSR